MTKEKIHFSFDGEAIKISSHIDPVFNFLKGIENEVEGILDSHKRLECIHKNYVEVLKHVNFLNNKLKEKDMNFQYKEYVIKEKVKRNLKNFQLGSLLRSQVIVLFASLEVLFNLHLAYEHETADEEKLFALSKDNIKKFLNQFLLTDENNYYKANKSRLSKIDSTKLRDLRNSLTHFFSVSPNLPLAPSVQDQNSRTIENKLKQNKEGHIVFLSENDLFQIIRDANLLRFKKWSDDYKKDPIEFTRKIHFVIELVEEKGAVIAEFKDPKA